jgi:hypothetical protein
VYLLLADPLYVVPPNNPSWFHFFNSVVALVKKFNLHKPEGRGAVLQLLDYLPLRIEISHLHGAGYDNIPNFQMAYANGPATIRTIVDTAVAHEEYPEASDEFLIQTLKTRYRADDVVGYGGRVKLLQQIFEKMDSVRAKVIRQRLLTRRAGDPISIDFHDKLSQATRTALLETLRLR